MHYSIDSMFALLLSALENNALNIKNVCSQLHLEDREAILVYSVQAILYFMLLGKCAADVHGMRSPQPSASTTDR